MFKYDPHALRKTIDDVSIHVPQGKVTAIVGASGSGKIHCKGHPMEAVEWLAPFKRYTERLREHVEHRTLEETAGLI